MHQKVTYFWQAKEANNLWISLHDWMKPFLLEVEFGFNIIMSKLNVCHAPCCFLAPTQQLVLQSPCFYHHTPNCEANDFFHTAGCLRLSHLVKYLMLNLHKPILPGRVNRWLVLRKNHPRFDRDVQEMQLIVPLSVTLHFLETCTCCCHICLGTDFGAIFCSQWQREERVQKNIVVCTAAKFIFTGAAQRESHKKMSSENKSLHYITGVCAF